VKTLAEIQGRLEKLIGRYRRRYVQSRTDRLPENCRYNYQHVDSRIAKNVEKEHVLAPRVSSTLVVIQSPAPVRLCTYNAISNNWNGTICDSEDVSRPCQFFRSKHPSIHYENEFDENMANDSWVMDKYPDVASLQWVLGVRRTNRRWFDMISDIWNYLRSLYAFRKDSSYRVIPKKLGREDSSDGGSSDNIGDAASNS
jgi:hypothetical protein